MAQRIGADGPVIIGLTGRLCAGKNFVAALFEARGVPVLDVDKLGYRVLEAEKETLTARFGTGILDGAGAVDRRRLGARVFGSAAELAALEAIVHPAANALTAGWVEAQRGPCVVNAALLHRSPVMGRLDALVLVRAPLAVRFVRAAARDRLPLFTLLRRFASQRNFPRGPRSYAQYLKGKTDIYIISNPAFGSPAALAKRVDLILGNCAESG
ncbi:MAG: dephospho-CoA kinase [Treponema sp.]|jgi:dephospho-CoA kinase|nr:dephospho-CoA kinase [Treponema sp.]